MVERRIEDPRAGGSIPSLGTRSPCDEFRRGGGIPEWSSGYDVWLWTRRVRFDSGLRDQFLKYEIDVLRILSGHGLVA